MTETPNDYPAMLRELAAEKPRVAALLQYVHSRREANLRQYFDGARLTGFEQLLEHLESVERVFRGHQRLSQIAFLLTRRRGEFGIALEASLSSLHTIAHDAMRSVMEIEFLFRDFSLDASRLEEWLRGDDESLHNRFRPAVLRQRFANLAGRRVNEMSEATDYRGHSRFLHVGPHQNPFGVSGLLGDEIEFATDSCFWEIFEHARRLLIAINALAEEMQPGLLAQHNPEQLEKLGEAWVRTQEMQQIWQQLIAFGPDAADGEN